MDEWMDGRNPPIQSSNLPSFQSNTFAFSSLLFDLFRHALSEKMIYGIGIDIVEIPRFAAFIQKQRHKLNRIFSAYELAAWERRGKVPSYLAVIFAAKEAVIKAIGKLSILTTELSEIEVKERGFRQFTVELRGETALLCRNIGIGEWRLNATFNGSIAMASVIAMRRVGHAASLSKREGKDAISHDR